MYRLFRIAIVFFFIVSGSYANVMRVVYFTPANVPGPTVEDISAVRNVMIESQKFYRDEMKRHGYDAKTFDLETDANGRVMIHAFRGKQNLSTYSNLGMIDVELPMVFRKTRKNPHNMRVIFLAGAHEIGTGAINFSECVGDMCDYTAYIPTENIAIELFTAHELGHSFQLQHNESIPNSNKAFLMKRTLTIHKNQPPKLVDFELDDYETDWLDKHKHFSQGRFGNVSMDIGKHNILIDGGSSVVLLIELSGIVELHQAQIFRPSDGRVLGWDKICGIEDTAILSVLRVYLSEPTLNLQIIDIEGNTSRSALTINLPEIPDPFAFKNEDNGTVTIPWSSLKVQYAK